MTTTLDYLYRRASEEGQRLIVGKAQDPNPIVSRKKLMLPLDKMRVGDALFFNKAEMLLWKWQLVIEIANRYNLKYGEIFGIVETDKQVELVRIR